MSKEIPFSREVEYTTPTGIKTTLYSINVLAEALGRTSQTVRKWELGGTIPPTPFRIHGRRFYSKEHIDIIVTVIQARVYISAAHFFILL